MKARMASACWYGAGFLIVVCSVASHLLAQAPVTVPEIDAGSVASGIGLVTGGVLILRSRWGSKK